MRGDIEIFVRTKLGENKTFAEACASDSKYPALIDDIVAKAEGLFVWARLAVQSLLNGITNADTVQELHKRLEELPPELEQLFEYMHNSKSGTKRRRERFSLSQYMSIVLFCS